MPILAVVFDCDGLLLDSEAVYHRSWTAASAEQGLVLDDAAYRQLIGQGIERSERLVAGMRPGFDLERFRRSWRERWRDEARAGVPAKAGAVELHGRLVAAGVPCAVATSSARPEAELSLAGWWNRFGAVVTGDQVLNSKPAPDIYLEAARRLGVPPECCLALEDSETGARAALAAGMALVVVPDLVQPSAWVRERARLVATSLIAAMPVVLAALDATSGTDAPVKTG
jgi:HAD superfamily hydrolase (TIGR01509 family)